MNYELARELKDTGFPQNHNWIDREEYPMLCSKCGQLDWEYTQRGKELNPCIPTLSELIEACGERFAILYRKGDEWAALADESCLHCTTWNTPGGTGSTPEEAVARLWLALNKK